MSRRYRLSTGALETLAEIEAEVRDGHTYTAAEMAECDELAATHAEAVADQGHDPYADATHDAAGFPLTDLYPW